MTAQSHTLFMNTASPYARKARILVREFGLIDRVTETVVAPIENPPALLAVNPLAQIPTLVLEGMVLSDSLLMGHYLCATQPQGPKLLPEENYWKVRQLEVLANGILEMCVKIVLENRRPENERSPKWLARWKDNIFRSLEVAETRVSGHGFDMGSLTLVIALTYVAFRFPDWKWSEKFPKLAALQAEIEKRPSFVDTYPK